MYCRKCGKQIPNDKLFCPDCSKESFSGVKERENSKTELPPVPPSFSRPIPQSDLPRSRRKESLHSDNSKEKSNSSKGSGCLVLSLIFLVLCVAFVAGLFITDKVKEKSISESTTASTVSALSSESSTKPTDESTERSKPSSKTQTQKTSDKVKKN